MYSKERTAMAVPTIDEVDDDIRFIRSRTEWAWTEEELATYRAWRLTDWDQNPDVGLSFRLRFGDIGEFHRVRREIEAR
jgi:hypothetical protein